MLLDREEKETVIRRELQDQVFNCTDPLSVWTALKLTRSVSPCSWISVWTPGVPVAKTLAASERAQNASPMTPVHIQRFVSGIFTFNMTGSLASRWVLDSSTWVYFQLAPFDLIL